jgi:hypothetical protein
MAEAPINNNDLVSFRGRTQSVRSKGSVMSKAASMQKRGLISEKQMGKLSAKVGVKGGLGKQPRVQDEDKRGGAVDEISPSNSPGKVIAAAEKPRDDAVSKLSAKLKAGPDPGSNINDTNAKAKVPGASGSANPASKFRKRGSDKTFRGQPQGEEFKDE